MESARTLLQEKIQHIEAATFEKVALEVFQYQSNHNLIYKEYLELLQVEPSTIHQLTDIPCLPISFFKHHILQTGCWEAQQIFSSSGTSGTTTSQHYARDLDWYAVNARRAFEIEYGPIQDYVILALLPAYLERKGSSLIYMANDFIEQSGHQASGFYLYNYEALIEQLKWCVAQQQPTLLLGVSFALWDLAEQFPLNLDQVIVMETGGMKGRRKEITRQALHAIFKEAFQVPSIHSEYGMTELFSQAYSTGNGIFTPAPTMRVYSREVTDPFAVERHGQTGALNIIDLANLDTISFIATDDLGKTYANGTFEVLGRLDASDIRGCNLLVM